MLRNKSTEEARKQREKEGRKELAKDSPPTGSEHAEELRLWLDEYAGPRSLDRRIESDSAVGRLDEAVQGALEDEKRGRVRPL